MYNNTMSEKRKVILGMSGGVDSTVSALLLQEQGYEVIGVTMLLWKDNSSSCSAASSSAEAKEVCRKLGIEHHELDLSSQFKEKVVDKFVNEYSACRTPNPCVECNRHFKFKALFEFGKTLGAELVATGHYARNSFDEELGIHVIKKSRSLKKDQSYVLYVIEKELIGNILFPLGDFETKEQIREIAAKHGFQAAQKPDSQEICFIPDNDHIAFLDKRIKPIGGRIINAENKVLGYHTGLTHYTIGQRKGLGISAPAPIFVTKLDKNTNSVIVGSNDDLFSNELIAENINWLIFDKLVQPMRVTAKIRYAAKDVPAEIIPVENNVKVIFDEPQRAITPGQSVVFYKNDYIVGGGIIK